MNIQSTLLVLFTLLNISCGTVAEGRIAYQDPRAEEYALMYERLYNTNVGYIQITFDEKEFTKSTTVVGVCIYGKDRRIVLKPSDWENMSTTTKRNLIFHELGHCHQGRDHRDEKYPDGCPMSIMHPQLPWDVCSRKYNEDYLHELGKK